MSNVGQNTRGQGLFRGSPSMERGHDVGGLSPLPTTAWIQLAEEGVRGEPAQHHWPGEQSGLTGPESAAATLPSVR